jgi:catechol-2,3-dioxygenase
MRPIPMLACASVHGSSEWYQHVLGLTSAHGGDEYEMLTHDGVLVLQLHELDADEHPHLVRAGESLGNGVAVWFETDHYPAVLERVRRSRPAVVQDDHVNPLAQQREIWLRDPDGYLVVVSSGIGTAG